MKKLTVQGLGKMANRYGIIEEGVIVNICVGQPDNCVSVHLTGNLADAHKGDEIKGGRIVRPEPTALEIWQADVKDNREQTGKNIEDYQYNSLNSWNTKKNKHQARLLHREYEELKKEAPDGWTIDKEGYAVRK